MFQKINSILFKRNRHDAIMPKMYTSGSAGYDLNVLEDKILHPGESHKFDLGFSIKLINGTVGKIESRSSLAKQGLIPMGGIIDCDYIGPIFLIVKNIGDNPIDIKKGDRIAQLIVYKYRSSVIVEVVDFPEKTARGEGGFGSTGR